jgi:hypothetical protein
MARALISLSLLAALSSFAAADRAYAPATGSPAVPPIDRVGDVWQPTQFAKPPGIGAQSRRRVALDRTQVRAALARARATNLAAFRAYQRTGVFPSNTFGDKTLNVWRDDAGHLCAAATIIKKSGQDALVDRVADQNNFIRLADVTTGPLMDGILTSGFTQDEIVAIQEPFRPVGRLTPNDPVDPVVVDGRLRAAEDQRLIAKYRQVDAMLVKNQNSSLDVATDRLMRRPALAWSILSGSRDAD